MRDNIGAIAGWLAAVSEQAAHCAPYPFYRLAVVLDRMPGAVLRPAAHVREQRSRQTDRCLALVRCLLAEWLAVPDPAIEVDPAETFLSLEAGSADRARSGTGVAGADHPVGEMLALREGIALA